MPLRVAVIGSGISGLAAGYYLSRKHEVTLFEKDPRVGGHTHTVMVGRLPVDTGFIVHNERTYPNLVKLLAELGVATEASDMSFAVTDRRSGFEYSSRGANGFFAQRSNFLRASQYRLLRDILRFNREAPRLLHESGAEAATIGDFLAEGRYTDTFMERYLFPMASAVWSMSFDSIRAFPALTLIRFFDNHGMLGIDTHPQWRVIRGGSHQYLAPLSKPFADRVRTGVEIESVVRAEDAVTVKLRGHSAEPFDHVVFACHGDQVLPMLETPTERERDVLGNFRTTRNVACLHTDSSLLPRRRAARASWNYNLGLDGSGSCAVTYHMNRLQRLNTTEDYCVTLNGGAAV
ncbi:MAG: FAD-dependent oxidoreductase, partial [Candidatus Solibacter sp.]|nr:FAD-dependent oxidoreductase [Candidatus Solibacter sp.]